MFHSMLFGYTIWQCWVHTYLLSHFHIAVLTPHDSECIRLSARHSPGPAGSPSCRFIMLPGYVPGCPIWPGQIFRHTSHNASDLHIFSLDLHGFDRLRTEAKLWRPLIGQPWIMQEYVIRCPGVPSFCFIYTGQPWQPASCRHMTRAPIIERTPC